MLPVGPKPILEHIIDWLRDNGIKDVVIATGYLGRMIETYFGNGKDFQVRIEYARSDRPLGHAGQLKSAEKLLQGSRRFICLYGDAILNFDLEELLEFHARKEAFLTMALMEYETKMKYGVMETDAEGLISAWREKPSVKNDINVGCYAVERGFLDYIPAGEVYGMKEAIEAAMRDNKGVYAVKVKGTFTDIGDIAAHKEADKAYIQRYGRIP